VFAWFLGFSVRLASETEAEADDRTSQAVKPKPKPKTEKTDISVRFGLVRFGVVFGFRLKTAQTDKFHILLIMF
jgi:hypothetical protein